ncbi:YbjQ family protein [Sediminivirga luteola]|uniref:UPF0145 protein GCM10011333_11650 n=1 Tax=Sediminivirga luteola TaxID=1774748 RepID=A0A8J2TX62_9MICO|nr:YbjQ family protein [Sediminivirga luteola]MCI2265444.1 YbjQ family protein [Sediminivirga luteola]GGA10525.1 hypothetical protein GCM10011333_11650 [Sediminivirga luteola]
MIVVTTDSVPGYRTDAIFGEVTGLTVRARSALANWTAGWRSIGGGEITEFTQALQESRQEAIARMVSDAQARGGNAVLGMRFETSEIGQQWVQLCAYGTAAVVLPIPAGQPGATGQSGQMAAQGQPPRPAPAPPIDFQPHRQHPPHPPQR